MGKPLPKKGNTLPSGYDIVIDSLATAIGMLLTGRGDVKDSNSLAGKATSEGKPENKNKGILGLLSNISNNTDIIVGGQNKSFIEYLNVAKDNAKYLK